MDTNDKIKFFHELIRCNYDLSLWSYAADYNLLHTTSDEKDIIKSVGFRDAIDAHLSSGNHAPLVLETGLGMLWLTGFEFHGNELHRIHLLGTAFTGRDTPVILLKRMNTYDFSVKLRAFIIKLVSEMPVIAMNTLTNYAVMLHYTLNGEKITSHDIIYAATNSKQRFEKLEVLPDEHSGIWMHEQQLCKMFEDGDPNYKNALSASSNLSSGVKINIEDSLRKHKNNSLVLLTLCSRSCMKGGLNPSIAYNLNDYYATLFEKASSASELNKITAEMVADYITRVQETKRNSQVSPLIQDTCYYITQHLTESERLSIQELAKRIGYTEYYFSHKFKKETGYSVNDFILNEKISQAKLLLSGTKQSIQDISDSLAFCNRSYFYSCFQKKVGMSPTEYRKQPAKQS